MNYGSDIAIADLQTRVAAIPYMDMVFGRAMIFYERRAETGLTKLPKALADNNEYEIVLPRENFNCQSYFIATQHEKYGEYDRNQLGEVSRQFAVVFWGKLGFNNVPISLEQVKNDFWKALQGSSFVDSIDDYADETYQQVFPEFVDYLRNRESDTQWLMAPFAGFRLLFTISYRQQIC